MRINVPLPALRIFEAAARHESFRLAGLELNVSGSAVSQQIATLEAILHVRLFVRLNRRVELTEVGQTLARSLRATFGDIEAALVAAAPHLATDTVRVAIYQTLASRWLIPRLADLSARSPLLCVELETGMAEIDFEKTNFDFAIRVGYGEWENAKIYKLFDEILVPVCAPRFKSLLNVISDLNAVNLIHSLNRPDDWDFWLRATGHPNVKGQARLKFANSSLTYEAAAAGAGVALGQAAFVAGDLAAGILLSPFAIAVPTGRAYWLVEPTNRPPHPARTTFREWIREQVN